MSTASVSVGILGIASYLPDEVRTNDWWSPSLVSQWRNSRAPGREAPVPRTEGERLVLDAVVREKEDPFRGVRERRVLGADRLSSEMEISAAKEAIRRSGIATNEIDLLLCYSMCPDDLTLPNAFVIHEALGLKSSCFTTGIEATCNSFLMQLALAEAMIRSGGARRALLVQSCGISSLLEPEDPQSVWFGDAAGAAVLGPSDEGTGILATVHSTTSDLRCAVVTGVPGKRWYDEGRSVFYAKDRGAAYQILLRAADSARTVISGALAKAGVEASQVDFFACHQGQGWMRSVTQEYLGLVNARHLDTYAWTGNIGAANLPVILAGASNERMIRSGDLVLLFGGGAGVNVSATVVRWQ